MGGLHVSVSNRNLAIILGSSIGGCAVILAIGIVIFVVRKRRAKGRLLPTRAVTPLDDAEFESWRRPSKQIQWREKYNVLPEPPVRALTRMPSSSRRQRASLVSPVLEKEMGVPVYTYRPKPSRTPEPDIKPEHVRNKSSLSIQARPASPYSPTSSKENVYQGRPSSMSPKTNHVHYPSVSETSDFDFGFGAQNGQYDKI